MNRNTKQQLLQNSIIIFLSMSFYLFFAWHDGVVICEDSPTYISMNITREPLYPLLLEIMRRLIGENYLFAVVVFQSGLAAIAAVCIPLYFRRKHQMSIWWAMLLAAIPMGCSLLCRYAAQRASMYSNSILTEGIACSLFLIFICFLLDYGISQKYQPLLGAAITSFLLISTRKQMYFTLVLLFMIVLYVKIRQNKIIKGIVWAIICVMAVVLCNKVFDNAYGYVLRGAAHTHSGDDRFLATVVLYTSEREDGERIKDDEARELFYEIYDICESKHYLKHSAGSTWKDRVTHFGDSYDRIQIDTMWPIVENYVIEHYSAEDVERESRVDAITKEISCDLLPAVWPKLLSTFVDNLCSGFITTVAKVHPLLIWYTLIIYLAYIGMLFYLGFHRRFAPAFLFAGITLLSICLNVCLVSMVIFCQTRYTIYNMPIFYMSFLLLGREVYYVLMQSKRKTKNKGEGNALKQ